MTTAPIVRPKRNITRESAVGPLPAPPAPDVRAHTPLPPAPPVGRPTTLAEAAPWLAKPFPQSAIELKPGVTTQDKTRCLAMPYADLRVYVARLDRICGPEGWSSDIELTARGAICRLTVFGVTKTSTGDYPIDPKDENPATSAEAQAFKRACSLFGLGRYLYALPGVWCNYDAAKKQITDDVGAVVDKMYRSLPRDE